MINKVSSWASGLIASVIIGTIIEMILPDNKNKKYVKVVIGLFIIYTIIAPMIGKLDISNFNINNIIADYTDINQTNIIPVNTDVSFKQVYKQNIENDIIDKLNLKGYTVKKINSEISFTDDDNYGKIAFLHLKLKTENNKIDTIEEVDINVQIEDLNSEFEVNNEETIKIKNYLSETYGILTENIYIQLV